MRADVTGRAGALVFGGTGAVGREIVRGLAVAGIPTAFTWHRSEAAALELARGPSPRAVRADLSRAGAAGEVVDGLRREGFEPAVFIHCAAVTRPAPLARVTDADWELAHAVNCRSAFEACRALAGRMPRGGSVVLVGALDRAQSLPVPVAFAATQGMLSALTMALARELGPAGILVNMVALGVLESGLSRGLDAKLLSDYRAFSALRREGTPLEAARAILWLALENTYMSGKVLSVNGGI